MSAVLRLSAAALALAMLAGCAYRPLKAPCAAEEGGVPVAYSQLRLGSAAEPPRPHDRCGPMRPI